MSDPAIDVDVLVVGTGAAGLVAALAAHDAGASVAIVEKTDRVGGTTAISGGVLWVPNNHHQAKANLSDSRQEALAYVRRLAEGRSDDPLIETFIDTAPVMLRWVEEHTPLRTEVLSTYPDYHPELEGGKSAGRSLALELFDTNGLGAWKDKLRRGAVPGSAGVTTAEVVGWRLLSRPSQLPYPLLMERHQKGLVGQGAALAGGLLEGLLDREVEPMLQVAARALHVEDGRVVGLRAEQAGREILLRARRGVVLATGGFEWNQALVARFLSGPLTHPSSPPANEGDGLKMAMALGADLGNMSEAWWSPAVSLPGEAYDGRPLNRAEFSIRCLPHSILVNRKGQRFVNEARNYNDLMKSFFAFDPVTYDRPNLPAWLVVDQRFREKYMLAALAPGMPAPAWLASADGLEALARQAGIEPEGLAATVQRFNQFAREGVDRDFRRGAGAYDRFCGDADHQPNPNLGTLEKPPFCALQVHPGALGTKGGPRVNANAQILRVDGGVIEGLYGAGNVIAGVTGPGYPGAGGTLAPAMTFGFIAGRHAAGARPA